MSDNMEAMMQACAKAGTPGAEHQALADTCGTWSVTVTMWMDPSKPPDVSEGTAVRTMILGGRVLEERFSGPGMGGGPPFEGLGHTGYDNVTGRYWGTWTDNMMTGLGAFHGTCDAATKTSAFEGEMPDPMAGKLIPMRIETRTDEAGREINEFYRPGPDGQMFKSMELVYQRQ